MLKILEYYKYSIILFALVCFYLILSYGLSIFDLTIQFMTKINFFYFILSGLAGFIAALSFSIPYKVYIKSKGVKIGLKELLSSTTDFVYNDVAGNRADLNYASKLKVSEEEHKSMFKVVRTADMVSLIIIISTCILFITNNIVREFFIVALIFESIFVLSMLFLNLKIVRSVGMRAFVLLIASCIVRYFLELPRTLLTFYAVNIFLNIPVTFAFMASTSVLYFIPKYRGAGGLLAVYMMLFFPFIGSTILEGFITSTIFRISGIIFFMVPLYLYRNRGSLLK